MGTRAPSKHRQQLTLEISGIPIYSMQANAPQSEAVLEAVDDRRFVTVKPDRAHWAMGILEENIANLEV
jgi:hypothetical protein